MDFGWSDEHNLFREQVIRFAERELAGSMISSDAESAFDAKAWQKCAEFGIQGLPFPRAYGGQEADPLTVMMAMEALGYGCRDNGLIFSINAQMWACMTPIARYGTEEQKQQYLPGLCDGSLIAAHAMTEPDTGSDAFNLATTAVEDDDGFVLNGSKIFATNAPISDLLLVFATMDRSLGFAGLCAFVVERETRGLTVGKPLHKMGLRTSPMSEVFFDDCRVPTTSLLGRRGAGMAMFNHAMEWERSFILASVVGTMQRQLERTVTYARTRKQFGKHVGSFQSVSNRIVDMQLRLETSRLLLYRLGWRMSRGEATAADAALVKLHLSECFVQSSLDAVQVHGGYGYMAEFEIERELRDAIGSRLYSGTSEIQRNIAARGLGL